MTRHSWASPEDKQQATLQFLQALTQDTDESRALRERVVEDRAEALRVFAEVGEIDVPADTEIICLPNTTEKKDKVVVLLLPEHPEDITTRQQAFEYWIAAWRPYV